MKQGIDCKGKEWREIELKKGMKDYSNQIFNKLTALFPIRFNNQTGWLCKCECGNEIALLTNKITSGYTKSCGCYLKEKAKQRWNDYRQQNNKENSRFGILTLVNFVGVQKNEAIYHFKCDCGNEFDRSLRSVKNNNTQDCGCVSKKRKEEFRQSFIGRRFGKLTVLEYVKTDKNSNYIYRCQCDCGNTIQVSLNSLQTGNTSSCGCLRSIGENKIEAILKQNNINFKKQYSFNDLFSCKNSKLYYDFAILNSNNEVIRLIEFDGEQHNYAYSFFGGEEKLLITQKNDNIKNQYAKDHNIPLVRIPYHYKNKINLSLLFNNDNLIIN